MNFIKAVFLTVLVVTTAAAFAPRSEAAPLPTDVAAMKIALHAPVVQVRYGRWHGGWGYQRREATHHGHSGQYAGSRQHQVREPDK